jgi:eukaryotic-like serine/threonine-protein kinase
MDLAKAEFLAEKLVGKQVGGWEVKKLKDHGKSAAVFLAENDTATAAVKVFDDELIERFGDKVQLARIDRELTLVGKHHPSMVRILGGGFDEITRNHYIIMEYLDGLNLKQCLQDVPSDQVGTLISQLASCAEYLEGLGLCHRDIKPENIIIMEQFKRLILLDFGVLRPIGQPGLTDDGGIQPFIGTLQYSSPEFLLRQETDSLEGWRALSFYQIGAVLHDLIMRKELFHEFAQPYAKLVNAVQNINPTIQNSAVDPGLVELARSCLLKKPENRLRLLNWGSFHPRKDGESGLSAKQRVTNRAILAQAETSTPTQQATAGHAQCVNDTIDFLKNAIHLVRQDNDMFPPLAIATRVKNRDQFKIRMRASTAHELADDLTIFVGVEVLDPGAKAITMSIKAFLGKEPAGSGPQTEFFQGLYDSATMHSAFEESLYCVIELAQRRRENGGWLLVADPPEEK